jgi:hypothetical protein
MGPRAGLDEMEKWKFLTLPELELRPLARHYTDCTTVALYITGTNRNHGLTKKLALKKHSNPTLKNEIETTTYCFNIYCVFFSAPFCGVRISPNISALDL